MAPWLRAVLPIALLQVMAFVGPAQSATKVSFGQVSPTATMWPGVVASKKGFFAANGIEMDIVSIGVSPGMQAVASGSLNIMHNIEGEEPPARPKGDNRRYLDDSMLAGAR
jgi:ABC-type nitrate/sulfonate/bicarbonate transport system substrate-binding protein